MHDSVSLNHQIIKKEDAALPAISEFGMYGRGVFTTMAVQDRLPLLLSRHLERLVRHAKQLSIETDLFDADTMTRSISGLLAENGVKRGKCRVTLMDNRGTKLWPVEHPRSLNILIQTGERVEQPVSFSIGLSNHTVNSRSLLSRIKSTNYLDQLLAAESSASMGFDESIRINENKHLVSGCFANLFWVVDETIFTPSIESGCLDGVTRDFVMGKIDVVEEIVGIGALLDADSVFLTSSGIGIKEVRSIQHNDRSVDFKTLPKSISEHPKLSGLIGW